MHKRLDKKLLTEARHKYRSFKLGLSEIKDFEKRRVTEGSILKHKQKQEDTERSLLDVENHELYQEKDLKIRKVPEHVQVNIHNYRDIQAGAFNLGDEEDEGEESRKGTPNPYALHVKRERVKEEIKLRNAVSKHALLQA